MFEEEIAVRGRDPERFVARETHHGPIVNEALRADESEPLALAWMSRVVPGDLARQHGRRSTCAAAPSWSS